MQELNMSEIEEVSGGISVGGAAKITLGLMALAVGSPVVIGVGCIALVTMALL